MKTIGIRLAALASLIALPLGTPVRAEDAGQPCAAADLATVLQSEQLLEALRAPLKALSRDAAQGALPGAQSRAYFEPLVGVVDLGSGARQETRGVTDIGAARSTLPVAQKEQTVTALELSLWSAFFQQVKSTEHFSFYNVRGTYEGQSGFRTVTGFKGLVRLRSGKLAHVQGKTSILWTRSDAQGCGAFR